MKTTIAVKNFSKCYIVDVWKGSEYASVSDFERNRVLNMLRLHKVLNIPVYAWIISEHAWICQVFVKMSKSAWKAFVLFYWLWSLAYLNAWLLISMLIWTRS